MGIAYIIPEMNFGETDLGKVTFASKETVSGISINSPQEITGKKKLSITYSPVATYQRGVKWEIVEGKEFASINEISGLLESNLIAYKSRVKVKATSLYNEELYDEVVLSVTFGDSIDKRIDLSQYELNDGWAISYPELIWRNFQNYACKIVPIQEGANGIRVISTKFCPSEGTTLVYLQGGSAGVSGCIDYINIREANKEYDYPVPEGATHVYIQVLGPTGEHIYSKLEWY